MMRTVIIFCLCLSAFAAQAQNDVNYTYMGQPFPTIAGGVGQRGASGGKGRAGKAGL